MGASLRTEAELLGHEPGRPNVAPGGFRELTAQERILVHQPENYGRIAALVDTCLEFGERPCRGGECEGDDEHPIVCPRHARTAQVSQRYHRLRQRAFARVVELCRAKLRAAPWSPDELAAQAELDNYRATFVDVAFDRAMTLDYPGVPWAGRCA